MKIAIVGYSGAGKSTLAKQLSEYFKIPCYHLDKIQFSKDWELRDRKEADELVHDLMIQDEWIIDGNYNEFDFEHRMADANIIIFLNYPRRICLYRALKRNIQYHNRVRDSISEGCNEKFDFEFFWWIMVEGRSSEFKNRLKNLNEKYPKKYHEIKNNKQLTKFIKQLESKV